MKMVSIVLITLILTLMTSMTLMALMAAITLMTIFKMGSKAIGGGGVGSLVQKLKAGAAAEAKGEQNPSLINNNKSSSNSNNDNTEGKGKRVSMKALLKKKHQLTGAEDPKQLTLKKMGENEGQHQPQTVDWSAWDAC